MALLSMTGRWGGQAFVEDEIPFLPWLKRWVLVQESQKRFIFNGD
jgi:hypothetical protein